MNPETEQYDEKINNIKRSFFSALDDFKKYYVYYNKNPEVNEFQNYFSNSKGQLQGLSSDMFLTTNSIQKKIQDLDNEMKTTSMNLETEKNLNEELMKLMKKLETTQDGSKIMIDDVKEEYNTQYYKNWQLFIGIGIITKLILHSIQQQ
jgi:hypothetical protein